MENLDMSEAITRIFVGVGIALPFHSFASPPFIPFPPSFLHCKTAPLMQLEFLGERSPSGSGQSPADKRFLVNLDQLTTT